MHIDDKTMKTKNPVLPMATISQNIGGIVTDAKQRTITVQKIILQSKFSLKTSALISNQSNVQGKEEQPHTSSTLRFN